MTHLDTKAAHFDTGRVSAFPSIARTRADRIGRAELRGLGLVFELHRFEPGTLVLDPRLRLDLVGLDARAQSSLFQSLIWFEAWTKTVGRAVGEHPILAVGRDRDGVAKALVPLALVHRHGCRVITWLGAPHLGYGEPVLDVGLGTGVDVGALDALLRDLARASGADVVHLASRPALCVTWPHRGSVRDANDSFVLALDQDFEAQYRALFSAKTRSQVRRKWRRLESAGAVRVAEPSGSAERLAVLDEFFRQKGEQLRASGAPNVFAEAAIKTFYREFASWDTAAGGLHLSALLVGDRTAAIVMSMRHRDRVYMLNTSISPDLDLTEASPGKLLIHQHVRASHAAGATIYDFGPGAAAYKQEWHTAPVALVTTIFGLSLRGRVAAAVITAAVSAKRMIKRSPALWGLAQSTRRALATNKAEPGRGTRTGSARKESEGAE